MTKIVGILNITPDSFFDGGKFLNAAAALRQFRKLGAEGADIIDIGAQSTRPGAKIISAKEEWRRLEPLLKALAKSKNKTRISIDSYNPETIKKALNYKIDIINDVSGLRSPAMRKLAAISGKKVILMHSLSIPANKKIVFPEKADVIKELDKWLGRKIKELQRSGIKKQNIIFDPGLGFGTTPLQSLNIIMSIEKFRKHGVPILIGHSEKSFLSLFTEKLTGQRGNETKIFSYVLAQKKIDYIRVHDVAGNKKVIDLV